MSEGIAVAVLGFFGIIVTTLGGIAVARTNKQVKVVKEHVQNNHIDPRTGEAYILTFTSVPSSGHSLLEPQ